MRSIINNIRYIFQKHYDLPAKYRRIYHYHIPKTGGTSLNFAFIGLSCEPDTIEQEYEKLANTKGHRKEIGDRFYVGWDKQNIERGNYFYGFSHKPAHTLNLPDRTYRITIFRDPLKRLLSYYHMYRYYILNDIQHPSITDNKPWLGKPLSQFIDLIPKNILLNQLYYFSNSYDVEEALHTVKNSVDHYWLTKNFNEGLSILNQHLNLTLVTRREKNFGYKENHQSELLNELKNRLEPEYTFINNLESVDLSNNSL